nr:hypothetical protein [Tanacetum cinerariifolium]
TIADVNVNAPTEQAPAMAPPTRTDEQILPRSSWGKLGHDLLEQELPVEKLDHELLEQEIPVD